MVITHDSTLVNNMKTRVISLKDGKVINDEGKKKDLHNHELPLFISLNKTIRKKLTQSKISDIGKLLTLTEDDLEKIGLTDEETKELSDKLQTYLSSQK